ncbi:MAG: zinc-binding alcohol dehydrogenase [Rhodospirillaceae bacterium]
MPENQALWYVGENRAELRSEPMPVPAVGQVIVKARFSGVSRGTERLVASGHVPLSEHSRMRCPHQAGEFSFPVKYGYALCGAIEDGPKKQLGQRVFVLHPHQKFSRVAVSAAHLIPGDVPLRRAALAANMETAVNVLWDAAVMPGEKVLVIGGGVLGLLIAGLLSRTHKNEVVVVDINPNRRTETEALGASFMRPQDTLSEFSVVIHTSATEDGLRRALECAAPDGRIIEASWFGDKKIALPLGEAFHSRRLRIISSQVGAIPPSHRSRWTPAQRIQEALSHLRDDKFDALITNQIRFEESSEKLPKLFADGEKGLMTVLSYE